MRKKVLFSFIVMIPVMFLVGFILYNVNADTANEENNDGVKCEYNALSAFYEHLTILHGIGQEHVYTIVSIAELHEFLLTRIDDGNFLYCLLDFAELCEYVKCFKYYDNPYITYIERFNDDRCVDTFLSVYYDMSRNMRLYVNLFDYVSVLENYEYLHALIGGSPLDNYTEYDFHHSNYLLENAESYGLVYCPERMGFFHPYYDNAFDVSACFDGNPYLVIREVREYPCFTPRFYIDDVETDMCINQIKNLYSFYDTDFFDAHETQTSNVSICEPYTSCINTYVELVSSHNTGPTNSFCYTVIIAKEHKCVKCHRLVREERITEFGPPHIMTTEIVLGMYATHFSNCPVGCILTIYLGRACTRGCGHTIITQRITQPLGPH